MKAPLQGIVVALTLVMSISVFPSLALGAAQDGTGMPVPRGFMPDGNAAEQQVRVSQREASDRARQVFPGRVLDIRLEDGQWRIRMDQEGNVFNVLVDASSGRVQRPGD